MRLSHREEGAERRGGLSSVRGITRRTQTGRTIRSIATESRPTLSSSGVAIVGPPFRDTRPRPMAGNTRTIAGSGRDVKPGCACWGRTVARSTVQSTLTPPWKSEDARCRFHRMRRVPKRGRGIIRSRRGQGSRPAAILGGGMWPTNDEQASISRSLDIAPHAARRRGLRPARRSRPHSWRYQSVSR